MTAMTETIENRVLDEMFGGATFARPAAWCLGLLTAAPGDTTTGTEVSTVGTGYSRATSPNTTAHWNNAASGAKANATTITFPTASGANWGTITHMAFYDTTASNATMWFYSALTASKVVNVGDVVRFTSGSITLTAS